MEDLLTLTSIIDDLKKCLQSLKKHNTDRQYSINYAREKKKLIDEVHNNFVIIYRKVLPKFEHDQLENLLATGLEERNLHEEISKILNNIQEKIDKINLEQDIETEEGILDKLQSLEDKIFLQESNPDLNPETSSSIETNKMPSLSVADFVKLASSTIQSFDGNICLLDTYVEQIEVVELVTTEELQSVLFKIAKAKLSGRARECISSSITTTGQLKQTLRDKLKPESSKLLKTKISSLKLDKNFPEYSKQIEELGDALKRCLILEGTSEARAQSEVNEHVVDACRARVKTSEAKAIMGACTFENHRDVLAKFGDEKAKEKDEPSQVLYYKSRGKHFQNRGRYRGGQNNHYRNNNSSNNYRGRNNRGRGNNNYSNRQSNNSNDSRNVRFMSNQGQGSSSQGNSNCPETRHLGDVQ